MESMDHRLTQQELYRQVNEMYGELIREPEVREALDLLDNLPENLKYHNKGHTLDVIRETVLFGIHDRANPDVIKEQVIAAAWHDVGYIEQYEDNEVIAVELFYGSEAYKKLSQEDRDEVMGSILDTQIQFSEGGPTLEQESSKYGYLLDADVSNFGRDDFFEKSELIAEEQGIDMNNPIAKKAFFAFALKLMENHKWKTESAEMLRQKTKEENMEILRAEISEIDTKLHSQGV